MNNIKLFVHNILPLQCIITEEEGKLKTIFINQKTKESFEKMTDNIEKLEEELISLGWVRGYIPDVCVNGETVFTNNNLQE